MEGKIPDRFRAAGALPFNFVRGEVLIWAFDNVEMHRDRGMERRL
ncbi:MAG: hypothetical protein AB1700_13025 [Bacillota bacterium]